MLCRKGLKIISFLALITALLCIPMFVGTTYAAENIISTQGAPFLFCRVNGTQSTEITDGSTTPIFNYDKWEPGYTLVEQFALECKDTSVSYNFSFQITTDPSNLTDLAKVIHVYYLMDSVDLSIGRDTALSQMQYAGTLSEVLQNPSLFTHKADGTTNFTIALQMSPAAGNTYQGMPLFVSAGQPSCFNVKLTASADIPANP